MHHRVRIVDLADGSQRFDVPVNVVVVEQRDRSLRSPLRSEAEVTVEVVRHLLRRRLTPAQGDAAYRHRDGRREFALLPYAGIDTDHEVGGGDVELDRLRERDKRLVRVVPDVDDVGFLTLDAREKRREVR